MTLVLLILVLAALCWLGLKVYHASRRYLHLAKLRENPPPLVRFSVRLPAESEKSNHKMTRFYGRLHDLLPNDKRALKAQSNTVHMGLIGYGRPDGQAPNVRFVVWCHPDLAPAIQRNLIECYDGEAEVIAMRDEDDPFLRYLILSQQWDRYNAERKRLLAGEEGEEEGPEPGPLQRLRLPSLSALKGERAQAQPAELPQRSGEDEEGFYDQDGYWVYWDEVEPEERPAHLRDLSPPAPLSPPLPPPLAYPLEDSLPPPPEPSGPSSLPEPHYPPPVSDAQESSPQLGERPPLPDRPPMPKLPPR